MNTQADRHARQDGIVASIGVLVLLIGAATGSAFTMLIMAFVGLVAISLLHRQRLGTSTWLVMTVSAAIAAATAIAINMAG